MRIIGGIYKGRPLAALAGRQTRPTTDRVREAWASSVISLLPTGLAGARLLDAFAGSGALGLEAISRGAAAAVFVENDRRAYAVLWQNLRSLGLPDAKSANERAAFAQAVSPSTATAQALLADVFAGSTLARTQPFAPFDLVILDPPYDCSPARIAALLRRLLDGGQLAPGCLISYEQRARQEGGSTGKAEPHPGWPDELELVSRKAYGDSAIEYHLYKPNPNQSQQRDIEAR